MGWSPILGGEPHYEVPMWLMLEIIKPSSHNPNSRVQASKDSGSPDGGSLPPLRIPQHCTYEESMDDLVTLIVTLGL